MHVLILEFTSSAPETTGRVWIDGGAVRFSDLATAELCKQVAEDSRGPVTTAEPERFLRSLPMSLSGSMLRAQLVEDS